jgi:phospholipase/carboxylesterase
VQGVKSSGSASKHSHFSSLLEQREAPPYTLFAPSHYTPGYGYPLLVWMHGPGDDERQLRRILPYLSTQDYVAVGPRGCCPPDPGCLGYQWPQSDASVGAAARRVLDCIDVACDRYHVDPDRVFLGGYQTGGTAALRLALRNPERFAGVISVGGPFPRGASPLAQLRRIRSLPILLAQGRDSELYPMHRACDEIRLFHVAAMRVTVRQYPCGDDMTTQMLSDMHEWLMEQISGVSMSESERMQTVSGDTN